MRQAGALVIALGAHLGAFAASAPADSRWRAADATDPARPACEFMELTPERSQRDEARSQEPLVDDAAASRPAVTPRRRRAPAYRTSRREPEEEPAGERQQEHMEEHMEEYMAARTEEAASAISAPVDFTGRGEVSTTAFVVSAAEGAGASAGSPAAARTPGPAGGEEGPGRLGARGVAGAPRGITVSSRRWRCPWPAEADRLFVHRESATVRVCVDETGELERAALVRDPGHGFGRAALRCAKRASYSAATDDRGAPRSACAPLVVRFER